MTNNDEWKTYLDEGNRFYTIAERGLEKQKFPPETTFNLLGMSVEKLFMGLLLKYNTMPYNHTFADLIDSTEGICSLPGSLVTRLLEMDSFQEICSLDDYSRKEITGDNIKDFLEVTGELKTFITNQIDKSECV